MPRRDECYELKMVFALLKRMRMSEKDIHDWMYVVCEDCRLSEKCTGNFPNRLESDKDPPEHEPCNITEACFSCSECHDISETLEFINGELVETQKWKQRDGKMWHVHGDKLFECKKI